MSEQQRPRRIRLSRQRGWRKPEGAVVVARPTRWGNPFRMVRTDCSIGGMCWTVTDGTLTHDCLDTERHAREVAVELYDLHTGPMGNHELDLDEVCAALAGHDLACWCPLVDSEGNRMPCHADVLLAIANQER